MTRSNQTRSNLYMDDLVFFLRFLPKTDYMKEMFGTNINHSALMFFFFFLFFRLHFTSLSRRELFGGSYFSSLFVFMIIVLSRCSGTFQCWL